MKKLSWFAFLVGNALAASADVGSGPMIAVIASVIYHQSITPIVVAAAIFFALLPDFDIIIKFIQIKTKKGQLDSHHRTILHQPFFFFLAFILWLILSLISGWPLIWPLVFLMGSLAHFFHDSLGDENYPGIQWLAPFDKRRFTFFSRRAWRGEWQTIVRSEPEENGMGHIEWLQKF